MLHIISNTNFLNLEFKQNIAIGNNMECMKGGRRGKMAFLCSILGTIKKRENRTKRPMTIKKIPILSGNTSGL